MMTPSVPLHHAVLVEDHEREGQLLDAGEALRRLATVIEAQLEMTLHRDEPRYTLRKRHDPLELVLLAGHLYDSREVLSLAVELRYGGQLIASCGCASGIERIKLGSDTAWLRTSSGLHLILGAGPGGLLEVQD